MFEITEKLRQRFCKDNGINLQLFASPYFEERIELYGAKDKYDEFVKFVISEFDSPDAYLAYYNQFIDTIIDYIKNSTALIALNSDDMSKYPSFQAKSQDIYKPNNVGKTFCSVDIKKANFTALVHYAKATDTQFWSSYDYKEFIKQFTKYDYMAESKHIRQVVFGNCNPKRQIKYEAYLISTIINDLIAKNIIDVSDIYSLNHDEIIFDTSPEKQNALKKYFENPMEFPIEFTVFKLARLLNTVAYIKIIGDDTILKCVNPYEAPFVYRFMNHQEYQDTDSLFMFEG